MLVGEGLREQGNAFEAIGESLLDLLSQLNLPARLWSSVTRRAQVQVGGAREPLPAVVAVCQQRRCGGRRGDRTMGSLGNGHQVDCGLDRGLRLAALALGNYHATVGLDLWTVAEPPGGGEHEPRVAVGVPGLARRELHAP